MSIKYSTPETKLKDLELKKKFSTALSGRLKEVRKEKKLTQQELAEGAGLHLTYISHLELGRYHPSGYVLWKIAKTLKINPATLLDL